MKEIIYISGYGRSGTTILHNILSQTNGLVGGGEIREIWNHGWGRNQLCGCGESFADCSFWSGVESRMGLREKENIVQQMQTGRSRARDRHLPLLLFPNREKVCRERYQTYLRGLNRLYEAIHHETGGSIIVDSSKSPLYGYLLTLMPDTSVYFLHVIRDARGADFSLWKRKVSDDVSGFESYRSSTGALQWSLLNVTSEVLRSVEASRFLQVRYEDFARDPKQTISTILRFANQDTGELPFRDERTAHLDVTHTVAGNGRRFRTGDIEVRIDDSWKENSPRGNVRATTLLAAPLLAYYGYPLWVG